MPETAPLQFLQPSRRCQTKALRFSREGSTFGAAPQSPHLRRLNVALHGSISPFHCVGFRSLHAFSRSSQVDGMLPRAVWKASDLIGMVFWARMASPSVRSNISFSTAMVRSVGIFSPAAGPSVWAKGWYERMVAVSSYALPMDPVVCFTPLPKRIEERLSRRRGGSAERGA